ADYRTYVTKRKPFRKARHCHVRLKFAREHQYWSDNDWKCVAFSDESHFEVLNRKNRSFVRRLRSEQDKPFNVRARAQGGGGCVSVWGCMTAEGIGPLTVYKGRVNGKKYIDMLNLSLPSFIKKRFKPGQKWYFMQDNAPCHTCKFSKQWFEKKKYKLMRWPAASPDLNPIENLWDYIDKKLTHHRLSTAHELETIIKKLWSEINPETCNKLVESMPRRLQSCI
ncbi:unnamed protein product, partial [Didymodactylos carnosus]